MHRVLISNSNWFFHVSADKSSLECLFKDEFLCGYNIRDMYPMQLSWRVLRGTKFAGMHRGTLLLTWIRNCIRCGLSDEILLIHSQTPTVEPLMLGDRYVISPYTLLGMWLLFYGAIDVNSSTLSDAYMRQSIGTGFVQIMACRLFGAKPLSKPVLGYCQLDPLGANFSEISIKIQNFSFRKMHLRNGGHFVQGPLLLTWFNLNSSMDK